VSFRCCAQLKVALPGRCAGFSPGSGLVPFEPFLRILAGLGFGAPPVRGRLSGTAPLPAFGYQPSAGGLPSPVFAGQSEGDSVAEVDREGIVAVLGDQYSLAPFVHCPCHGVGHGFVELVFHAGTVGRGDGDREGGRSFNGSNLSCLECAGLSRAAGGPST
jgi:hypothetical protein